MGYHSCTKRVIKKMLSFYIPAIFLDFRCSTRASDGICPFICGGMQVFFNT